MFIVRGHPQSSSSPNRIGRGPGRGVLFFPVLLAPRPARLPEAENRQRAGPSSSLNLNLPMTSRITFHVSRFPLCGLCAPLWQLPLMPMPPALLQPQSLCAVCRVESHLGGVQNPSARALQAFFQKPPSVSIVRLPLKSGQLRNRCRPIRAKYGKAQDGKSAPSFAPVGPLSNLPLRSPRQLRRSSHQTPLPSRPLISSPFQQQRNTVCTHCLDRSQSRAFVSLTTEAYRLQFTAPLTQLLALILRLFLPSRQDEGNNSRSHTPTHDRKYPSPFHTPTLP
jgi:hypothetical protein